MSEAVKYSTHSRQQPSIIINNISTERIILLVLFSISHAHTSQTWVDEMWKMLENFRVFSLPIRFTRVAPYTTYNISSNSITIDYWLNFTSICSAHRDEVLSKNKYLEDEARRKAESVEREQNLQRKTNAAAAAAAKTNAGETPEAQDDEIFYDSDAEKQPEEWEID